jgi:hypothetical protein
METIIIAAVLAAVVIVGRIWGPVAGAIDAEWFRRS